ncbi:hypothetical protein I4F81_000809 [Pyropia yezoensis]|uniref:Uncharacterized protein n=1 Tax=Pyropia yezoensis TaxID=2788 RepID=A0ACC3BKT0_PYRYE|nr:hypothetical protein I4F81_000809 [Neopyropia yezoensis]
MVVGRGTRWDRCHRCRGAPRTAAAVTAPTTALAGSVVAAAAERDCHGGPPRGGLPVSTRVLERVGVWRNPQPPCRWLRLDGLHGGPNGCGRRNGRRWSGVQAAVERPWSKGWGGFADCGRCRLATTPSSPPTRPCSPAWYARVHPSRNLQPSPPVPSPSVHGRSSRMYRGGRHGRAVRGGPARALSTPRAAHGGHGGYGPA